MPFLTIIFFREKRESEQFRFKGFFNRNSVIMFAVDRYDPRAEEREKSTLRQGHSDKNRPRLAREEDVGDVRPDVGKKRKKIKRKRKDQNVPKPRPNREQNGSAVKFDRLNVNFEQNNATINDAMHVENESIIAKHERANLSIGKEDSANEKANGNEDAHDLHTKDTQDDLKRNTVGGSGDESSSVPSSADGEHDEDNSCDEDTHKKEPAAKPLLRVIAPEQKAPSTSAAKIRMRMADEGLDDFDDDDDNEEFMGSHANATEGTLRAPDTTQSATAAPSAQKRRRDAETATALRMSVLPIKEAAAVWDLAPFLIENLENDEHEHFFPIQSLVIPDVIASERHAHLRARDVCVSAPTGSGKTLAFVLPILNALSKRVVRRLRALVVLPSRDLALQVYKVFDRYTNGSDLRVGLAIGQTDFEAEQKSLIIGPSNRHSIGDVDIARHRYAFNPTSARIALEAFPHTNTAAPSASDWHSSLPKGGRSAVDVLVATPGRLMDHLDRTPGFTLQHLRFLVIDEADRLVNESYQNWIGRVIDATTASSAASEYTGSRHDDDDERKGLYSVPPLDLHSNGASFVIDPITWRRGGPSGNSDSINTNDAMSSVAAAVCRPVQLRKLLYSATLTKDPQKLASLGLVNPKFFDAHHLALKQDGHTDQLQEVANQNKSKQRYSLPDGLSEFTVECAAGQKPLVLLALLLDLTRVARENKSVSDGSSSGIVVVFTSSVDSTHRLSRLLQLLWGAARLGNTSSIAEFSSALSQKQRSKLIKCCTVSPNDSGNSQQSVSVVVCSDGMSRGMDIPFVSAVINYDVPSFAKTYVHRCGRTARAGREGKAISILKERQLGKFLRLRRLIDDPDRVKPMGVRKDLVRDVMPVYPECVRALRRVMDAEKDGKLKPIASLSAEWLPMRGSSNAGRSSSASDSEASSSYSSIISSDDDENSP